MSIEIGRADPLPLEGSNDFLGHRRLAGPINSRDGEQDSHGRELLFHTAPRPVSTSTSGPPRSYDPGIGRAGPTATRLPASIEVSRTLRRARTTRRCVTKASRGGSGRTEPPRPKGGE